MAFIFFFVTFELFDFDFEFFNPITESIIKNGKFLKQKTPKNFNKMYW